MQAIDSLKTETDQEREVKVILVDDTKEDSGIGSVSNVSSNSSMSERNHDAGMAQNIDKNIIIEFQALNCKSEKQRESTFVLNAGKMPAADISSIKGSANATISSEGIRLPHGN